MERLDGFMKPGERLGPSNTRVEPPRAQEANRATPPEPPATAARLPDEVVLIARCRGGDTGAFRILVERHRDRAYALAFRILRSGPDAEEVAQDAFVRAWLGIGEYRGDAAFSTWLHRIVARRALDRAAVLRGRRAREERLEEAEAPGVAGDGPSLDWRRIARLVEELPEAQRGVISLFYFEARSVADVARILSMPEGTVKTHLSRARAALRQEWMRRARTQDLNEL